MSIVKVEKNTYTVDSLYQWDLNQVLTIYGLSLASIPEIHFTNDAMDRAIVRQASMNAAGVITADVPNSLLQKAAKIKAYVCIYEGNTFKSLYKIEIPVKARNKPSDYTLIDDPEVYSFDALENQVVNALAALDTHAGNKNNPHGVTAAQVGAVAKADGFVENNNNDQLILKRASINPSRVRFENKRGILGYFGNDSSIDSGLYRWLADGTTKYKIYDTGNKPTAADIGAPSLTGNNVLLRPLRIDAGDAGINLTWAEKQTYMAQFVIGYHTAWINAFNDRANQNTYRALGVRTSHYSDGMKDALILIDSVDGKDPVTYPVLHTGNKPSGSYTGNGSATERTIATGGIGGVCYITGNGEGGHIVTPDGVFKVKGGAVSGMGSSVARATNGNIILASATSLNENGKTYSYQWL